MEKKRIGSILFTTLIACVLVLVVLTDYLSTPFSDENASVGYSSDTVNAVVEEILEEGQVDMGEITQEYQIVSVRVTEGEYEGQTFEIDHGKRQLRPDGFMLESGDKLLVSINKGPDGTIYPYFVDYVRKQPLLILVLIFIVAAILVSGWKGVRSLLSIGFSVVVILYFIVPRILDGQNPIVISLIGSFVFLAVTQYLVYGWTLKTHIAMVGIIFAVLVTGVLAVVFVDFSYLSGFGDENSMYLMSVAGNINIKNLLVASIIIGTLGVLDDLVIGQTSAVMEIYLANNNLTFRQRFRGSMNIGRDHVAATVNTLLLAYLGASLSMFLLFSINRVDVLNLININYIAEEIVRSLVGTLGLFMAVPITTAVACWAVDDPVRLEKLTRIFGPVTDEYGR